MQMYQIYVAFASTVSEEYFDVVYKKATDYAHCFLYIDKKKKSQFVSIFYADFYAISNSSPLETQNKLIVQKCFYTNS